jgi:SAM-dependent methyltransferase
MEAAAERAAAFKAKVREEWDDDVTVAAWQRWHAPFAIQTAAATEAIIEAARPQPGMQVLDLASGSGEPAIALARRVEPGGRVTATDMSSGMLGVARDNARSAGVTNVRFHRDDAERLFFPDTSFDIVTCRFGVMFFPSVVVALREARRVLRPTGRLALAAWGPPTQPYIASTVGVLMRHLDPPPPPPPPDAPTPFRFAQPGSLTRALEEAGFTGIEEDQRTIPLPWPGPAEELWLHFADVAAPFRALIEGLGERREAAVADIVGTLRGYERGGEIVMDGEIVVASGEAG